VWVCNVKVNMTAGALSSQDDGIGNSMLF